MERALFKYLLRGGKYSIDHLDTLIIIGCLCNREKTRKKETQKCH